MKNPFAEGESRVVRPPSTALIIFGATGDLAHRKLLPALYNLAQDGYLPEHFLVLGASRTKLSDQEFREKTFESLSQYSRREISQKTWEDFSKSLFYQPLDGTKAPDFEALAKRLKDLGKESQEDLHHVYYLATSPRHFGTIAGNLRAAGLVEPPSEGLRSTRLIVEKPFGRDLYSARELNSVLQQNFAEEQIFRIDHYLGKETVQNILVFRFSNGIFEPLWNHKYIDHIQISVCESIGVEGRAGYFDQTGILRDIVQNHLLQMLALLCIEPPISLSDSDSIRDEKVKVLRSLCRLELDQVPNSTVRGQYGSGYVQGQPVLSYHEEEGVEKHSVTETYCALRLQIDNWRWSGVPIYIRAGKRLPKRVTEITVHFKSPPAALFAGRQVNALLANVLSIQVQPNEGITLKINSKAPGPRMRVRPVEMDFSYHDSFAFPSSEAYERLLLDAMKGDATLFTRSDEIEQAWDVLSPIMEVWKNASQPLLASYQAGSWGPEEADALLARSGHQWRLL